VPRKTLVVPTDLGHKAAEAFNRSGISFVFTELGVALTFCQESLSAGEPSKAIRAARYARQAFKEALKKRKEFVFSAGERENFTERVLELKTLFRAISRRKIPAGPGWAQTSESPER
jgi:hypothetical protein